MFDNLPGIELLFSQEDPQQSRLPSTISTDEPDFGIISDGRFRIIEQYLIAVTFVGVANLKKYGRGTW